jgi:hypothetical protein
VQVKVQRLKTGPIQLREHTLTEKHAGLEASIKVAAPPLDLPYYRTVTYPGDSKTLIKSSKGRRVLTFNIIYFIRAFNFWKSKVLLE